MTTATLFTGRNIRLNWSASGTDRVIQNVYNLLNLIRYDVAYDRTLGIDPNIVDMPSSEAAVLYVKEIYRIIEANEPRATVVSVEESGFTLSGDFQFKVVIDIVG